MKEIKKRLETSIEMGVQELFDNLLNDDYYSDIKDGEFLRVSSSAMYNLTKHLLEQFFELVKDEEQFNWIRNKMIKDVDCLIEVSKKRRKELLEKIKKEENEERA